MLHSLFQFWFELVQTGGYLGVFGLMAMESSIFPVPSEIVMPPAAFWATQGTMSFAGVVIAGTAGSYFGSAVSYLVARRYGMPLLLKYGKYVLLSPHHVQLAQAWVQRYGTAGVFTARLLPVVRHLISIPCGALRMPFWPFSIATITGALLWCWILAWFGASVLGQNPELLNSPEELVHVIRAHFTWFIGAVIVLAILFGIVMRFKHSTEKKV